MARKHLLPAFASILRPIAVGRAYDISATVISHPLYGAPLVALAAEGEPKCDRDL